MARPLFLSFSLFLPTLRIHAVAYPTPGKVYPLDHLFELAVCNFFLPFLPLTLPFFHTYHIIYFPCYLKKNFIYHYFCLIFLSILTYFYYFFFRLASLGFFYETKTRCIVLPIITFATSNELIGSIMKIICQKWD